MTADRYALFVCEKCDQGEFAAWLPPAQDGLEGWPECPRCGNPRPRLRCLLRRESRHEIDVESADLIAFLTLGNPDELLEPFNPMDAERMRERAEPLIEELRRRLGRKGDRDA